MRAATYAEHRATMREDMSISSMCFNIDAIQFDNTFNALRTGWEKCTGYDMLMHGAVMEYTYDIGGQRGCMASMRENMT